MTRRLIDLAPWLKQYDQRPADAAAARAVARAFLVQARQLIRLGLEAAPEAAALKGRYEALTNLLTETKESAK